jgi:transcriptional regulator
MYSPAHFKIEDRAELLAFMRRHSFATIVTHDGAVPHATHMPVLMREKEGTHGTLVTHMARANPQWRHFADGREVLVMFTGPHAYVSPAWYATQPAVPTWNYTAVHAYGRPRIVDDPARFTAMLNELVEFYESPREDRWPGVMPGEFRDRLMAGIVGIEIEVTRIEGKFKLSQNRSDEDRAGVITALSASADQTDREVAELMRGLASP